ncbi:MAG: CpaF family protein [Lachnospiraceae bacterium]|nr:CpaF family protein [Lachnospiraceae bacterium]
MAKNYFMDEVSVLKTLAQDASRQREFTKEELDEFVSEKLKERQKWARDNDFELFQYYQNLSFKDRNVLKFTIIESVEGLGILGKIIMDPDITEIMINGYDTIFVEKAGKLSRLDEHFRDDEDLKRIVQKFVSAMDRTVDASNPIVDARLEDGSRVHVVFPPVALKGATVTIRRFSKNPMTVEKLLEYKSITPEVADFLKKVVESRHNVFVSGGTGSGKTTFLNALSNFIHPWERVITIEDSAELQIKNIPNLVSLETRKANSKEANEITIRDLIKASLRMRPDRIIVGEVRGEEALDMLQAMNTGHDGSLSTGHANSPEGMLSRLETMVLTGSADLPLEAIRQQIATAVDYIVHLSRLRDFSRKCMEICEVVGYIDGRIVLNPIFKFEEDEKSTLEKVSGRLKRTDNKIIKQDKFILAGIYDYLEKNDGAGTDQKKN